MKRNIIQLYAIKDYLLALCDDGSLWKRDIISKIVEYYDDSGSRKSKFVEPWIQLEGVPDAPEESKITSIPNPTSGTIIRKFS